MRRYFCVGFILVLSVATVRADDKTVCLSNTANTDDVIAACSRVIASGSLKGKDAVGAFTMRAYFYAGKKDYDRAIRDLIEVIRLDPKSAVAFHYRAGSYAAKGDHDRAISDYSEAIRLDPRHTDAYFNRAASYAAKGDLDRAIADCTAVIRLDPKSADAYLNRAAIYITIKDYDRAISDYSEAIRLDPKSGNAFFRRGASYVAKEDFDRGIADYTEVMRLDPKNTSVLKYRGMAYGDKGDQDRAMLDFNEAIRLDPKDSIAFSARGVAFSIKNDHARAIVEFTESIRLDPKLAAAFFSRGSSYAAIKDHDRAIADFNEAVKLDPKKANEEMFGLRANSYYFKKDYERCISDSTEAIRIAPANSRLRYNRALCHFERKDYDRAISDYDEAIRLDPKLDEAIKGRGATIKARDEVKTAKVDPAAPLASQSAPPRGKRVALVMGNGAYKNVPRLNNTIIDARTMRDVLKRLNFEVVYGEDLDKRSMGRLIGEFGSIVDDAEAAIVYFAGHGSTFADIPYVVPIDSEYKDLGKIPSELVQVESLVSGLRRAKGVRLAVLDACRDNEREIQLKREEAALRGEAKRGGSVSQGLAPLKNANGLIVVYSTQYLTTAADGNPGGNSPFTGALARYMVSPKMDIKDVLFRAGQEVMAKTGGTQRPEISISLFDPFVLVE